MASGKSQMSSEQPIRPTGAVINTNNDHHGFFYIFYSAKLRVHNVGLSQRVIGRGIWLKQKQNSRSCRVTKRILFFSVKIPLNIQYTYFVKIVGPQNSSTVSIRPITL